MVSISTSVKTAFYEDGFNGESNVNEGSDDRPDRLRSEWRDYASTKTSTTAATARDRRPRPTTTTDDADGDYIDESDD